MNLRERAYCDRILRVDLTSGEIENTSLPADAMPLILGGKGLGAWLLYHEQPGGVAPLSPENHLIFHNGPLTGTTAPTAGRFGCTTRSPATGTYSDSYCGGYWGQKLKYAGFDALVLTGCAPEPSILLIDGNQAKIKPAAHLWGLNITETTNRLWEEFGRDWQSLVIGPPGEKQRNIAGIFNETRALARGGVGAVMGSKNLKAIVVRGNGYVKVHAPEKYQRALQLAFRAVRMSSEITLLSKEGTANILEIVNVMGALPTRNFQGGHFEAAEAVSGWAFGKHEWVKDYACFGCPIACGKYTRPLEDGVLIEGPEYETIYAFGPNCAIGDRETIMRLNWWCDEYGLDTISTGGVVGFVMEMFERGMIERERPGWNRSRALGMLRPPWRWWRRWPALKVVANGYLKGWPPSPSVIQKRMILPCMSKALEMPGYHPNAAKGTALAYAISERGACHLRGAPLGELFSGAADPLSIDGKPQLFRDHQADKAVWDSACLCYFPGYGMKLKELWQLVNAATGFDYASAGEFELIGERISTLARLFNVREGFTRADDILPARNLSQPLSVGSGGGQVVDLTPMLDEYYQIMGWDVNGVPTSEQLDELKIKP